MNLFDTVAGIEPAFTATFDQSKVVGQNALVGDLHAALAVLMNRQKNELLQKNPSGTILCHIVGPMAFTVLQSAAMSAFGNEVSRLEDGTIYVNGTQLIINPYWDEDQPVRTVHVALSGDVNVGEVFLQNISFI